MIHSLDFDSICRGGDDTTTISMTNSGSTKNKSEFRYLVGGESRKLFQDPSSELGGRLFGVVAPIVETRGESELCAVPHTLIPVVLVDAAIVLFQYLKRAWNSLDHIDRLIRPDAVDQIEGDLLALFGIAPVYLFVNVKVLPVKVRIVPLDGINHWYASPCSIFPDKFNILTQYILHSVHPVHMDHEWCDRSSS